MDELKASKSASSQLPFSLPIAETISNEHECSYLDNRMANLPLQLPSRILTLDEFDHALAAGMRRSGVFLYQTACHECSACEPSRLDVHRFAWRDSFKRVLKRGDQSLEIKVARPILDEQRLDIFNLHRSQRGLGPADSMYRSEDYEHFLVDSCLSKSIEMSFWMDEELIAVSIVDCGRISLSAVYTYFDPRHSKLSLGTYSILKQIEFARDTGRQFAYLGMYVSQNRHLSYKARFTPQERWIDGKWVEFAT